MNAEYLIIDDHTEGEKVEHICKVVPDIGIPIFTCAFCIEAIRLCNPARFVIATNQMNTMGVP